MQQSEAEAQQDYFITSWTIVTFPLQEPPLNGHFQNLRLRLSLCQLSKPSGMWRGSLQNSGVSLADAASPSHVSLARHAASAPFMRLLGFLATIFAFAFARVAEKVKPVAQQLNGDQNSWLRWGHPSCRILERNVRAERFGRFLIFTRNSHGGNDPFSIFDFQLMTLKFFDDSMGRDG